MNTRSKSVVYGATIAAMYTVLTLISSSLGLASGVIQVRISEALTILPFFSPYAIGGLFAGCFISNMITGCALWDTVFGSLATLIGAVFTFYCGKLKFPKAKYLAPLGPIISNTLIIPPVLTYVYGVNEAYWFVCLTVCIGEIVSAGILGMILYFSIDKHKDRLF